MKTEKSENARGKMPHIFPKESERRGKRERRGDLPRPVGTALRCARRFRFAAAQTEGNAFSPTCRRERKRRSFHPFSWVGIAPFLCIAVTICCPSRVLRREDQRVLPKPFTGVAVAIFLRKKRKKRAKGKRLALSQARRKGAFLSRCVRFGRLGAGFFAHMPHRDDVLSIASARLPGTEKRQMARHAPLVQDVCWNSVKNWTNVKRHL